MQKPQFQFRSIDQCLLHFGDKVFIIQYSWSLINDTQDQFNTQLQMEAFIDQYQIHPIADIPHLARFSHSKK